MIKIVKVIFGIVIPAGLVELCPLVLM